MKELSSGIGDAIRNRNLITEGLAVEEIPTKYDMLNGKPPIFPERVSEGTVVVGAVFGTDK